MERGWASSAFLIKGFSQNLKPFGCLPTSGLIYQILIFPRHWKNLFRSSSSSWIVPLRAAVAHGTSCPADPDAPGRLKRYSNR
ncbi:hypothetical protein CASFOL_027484 [Castilleja foliolosa]|uniref:Uncharacterized protein n=1 Tax=Castilleja foliolosa TaxID=1961234 RepID=A0ABD3CEY1_9LAMI